MKLFDIHIGVSDSVIVTGKNPLLEGNVEGLLPNQFDVVRAQKGNLDIFCGMMCPVVMNNNDFVLPQDIKKEIKNHISVYEGMEKKGEAVLIKSKKDFEKKGLKIILGLEGVYFVNQEEDIDFLLEMFQRGVKVIGPMWNFRSNLFTNGLSSLGKKFLKVCENNKIIIDLAHGEGEEFFTILNNFNGKVIDSHTSLYSINQNKRNIKEFQVRAIADRKGMIGLTFVGEFVSGNKVEDVGRHFMQFIEKFGDKNLAIGSDFDGMDFSDLVNGLSDVREYKNLSNYLKKMKIPNKAIDNVFFGNALNFYKSAF